MNASRLALALLVSVVAFVTACEVRAPRGSSESRTATPTSPSTSSADTPGSDVEVQTFSLAGRDELLERLADIGWTEALTLPGGEPRRLQVWAGDGHWHARTTYRFDGMSVTLIQAETAGLPPGQLTTIRGQQGIQTDGGLYWIERDFTFSISSGNEELARSLGWVALR